MSGDGGGVIVGGMLLLGALPIVVGGALAIGAAYGAIKLGGVLVRAGVEAHQRAEEQRRLEAEQCSAELSRMYSGLQSALEDQRRQNEACRAELGRRMAESGEALRKTLEQTHPSEEWKQRVEQERQGMIRQLKQSTDAQREQIRQQTEREAARIIENMEQAQQAQARLVDWSSKQADRLALQKAESQKLLQDAVASVRLLKSLGGSYGDEDFDGRVDVMERNLVSATRQHEAGMYEISASLSQSVVTQSARIALDKAQRDMEREELRTQVLAKLEGLLESMEKCRHIDFVDDYADREATEDLNDFTQGKFLEVENTIRQRIEEARKRDITPALLRKLEDEFDQVLVSNANTVCETGRARLLDYYEKVRMMEKIADFMRSQNYTMEWAVNPGDDPSQKLTVRFVNPAAGNSVVLSLDKQMSAEQISRMLMDIHFFYSGGRPVTENEKQALRDRLMAALREAGMGGSLGCTGNVNLPSDRVELLDSERVRGEDPVPLFKT